MNLTLHAAKRSGLFALAQWTYRKRLNILCFHGFSFEREHEFRPKLFMSPKTFARRLAYLRQHGFNVLTLDEALLRLDRGESHIKDTVITIDDGFFSVLKIAAPVLKAYDYPATIYVTSYYSKYPNPIFRLVVQYMIWKTLVLEIDLRTLIPEAGSHPGALGSSTVRIDDSLCDWLTLYGERELDEDGRMALLEKLGQSLSVSMRELSSSRSLSLLTADEIRHLGSYGVDVQLHTHRHRFPRDGAALNEEITKNREYLATCSNSRLAHLCYPSGDWDRDMWPVLKNAGVVSATTCESGLNDRTTPRLALHRFLDGEHLSDIQFEAEITGFKQLLRDTRTVLNRGLSIAEQHLTEHYGGKKGWLQAISHRMIDALSLRPRDGRNTVVDYRRLVFACKGNICRSPYAEAKARQAGFAATSFGLDASTGTPANPSASLVAETRHVDLSGHKAMHINEFCFKPGDLVLVFEPSQLAALLRPGLLPKFVSVDLLGRWCSPKFPYLHDPYGLGDCYFNTCFDRIDQALAHLLIPSSSAPVTN